MEIVWSKISTPNSEYQVASVYQPPDHTYEAFELLDVLSDCCDQILHDDPSNVKIIIAGDINQLNIEEFVQQYSMQQMV